MDEGCGADQRPVATETGGNNPHPGNEIERRPLRNRGPDVIEQHRRHLRKPAPDRHNIQINQRRRRRDRMTQRPTAWR